MQLKNSWFILIASGLSMGQARAQALRPPAYFFAAASGWQEGPAPFTDNPSEHGTA